eukprot:6176915-Pleurochrysis_carterae.AAC.3
MLVAGARQLLEDDQVLFSGYRVPHPLEPAIQVKIQTRSQNPGPVQASPAVEDNNKELCNFTPDLMLCPTGCTKCTRQARGRAEDHEGQLCSGTERFHACAAIGAPPKGILVG